MNMTKAEQFYYDKMRVLGIDVVYPAIRIRLNGTT
jgi:hypothetical protein